MDSYEQSLRAISEPTAEEKTRWPKEPIVAPTDPFSDDRGGIFPLVDLTMRSAVLITSKKGTVRANHWHKTDWHFCYMISGSMEYYHRPHGSTEEPEVIIVKKGQQVFTPPLVDHAMKFLEDSEFLTLGRNARDQQTYEADVKRIELIKR